MDKLLFCVQVFGNRWDRRGSAGSSGNGRTSLAGCKDGPFFLVSRFILSQDYALGNRMADNGRLVHWTDWNGLEWIP
ncbi:Uncharacterized protein HZ326_13210 [Fusarium oxysporum f. sp. albedinis]|nr:Uncharacterized protein HZ326_13210 [Fusarium oxysporum f. sp. albedinis]